MIKALCSLLLMELYFFFKSTESFFFFFFFFPFSLHICFLEDSCNYDDLIGKKEKRKFEYERDGILSDKNPLSAECPVGLHAACGGDNIF